MAVQMAAGKLVFITFFDTHIYLDYAYGYIITFGSKYFFHQTADSLSKTANINVIRASLPQFYSFLGA